MQRATFGPRIVPSGSRIVPAVSARAYGSSDLVTPPSKLHFIDHPRYGKVYPILAYNFDKDYFKLPVMATLGLTACNSLVAYALFVDILIFTNAASSVLCNPLFFVPAFYTNAILWRKYYVNFLGTRS